MKYLLTLAVALVVFEGIAEAQCRGGRCGSGGGRMGGGRLFNRGGNGCNQGSCGSQGCGPQSFAPAQCQPCQGPACPTPVQIEAPKPPKDGAKGEAKTVAEPEVSLALIEVNAERQRRGLRPFTYCPLLTRAAKACAAIRASRFIEGHIDDFAHLPSGAHADASGCAAWPEGMGWGSCCTYEQYTYAGAAWVTGADGRRYMHLFVRR